MTLVIVTLVIMTLVIMTLVIMTLVKMTLVKMTLVIMKFNDRVIMPSAIMPSVIILNVIPLCNSTECQRGTWPGRNHRRRRGHIPGLVRLDCPRPGIEMPLSFLKPDSAGKFRS